MRCVRAECCFRYSGAQYPPFIICNYPDFCYHCSQVQYTTKHFCIYIVRKKVHKIDSVITTTSCLNYSDSITL